MRKFVVLLLIAGLCLADSFLVIPNEGWDYVQSNLSTKVKTYSVVNILNTTITVSISKGGQVASWITGVPSSLTINPNDAQQFTATIEPPEGTATGTYTGSLTFSYGSEVKEYSITARIDNPYSFSKSVWVKPGYSVNVTPMGYRIAVVSIDSLVAIDFYAGDIKIQENYLMGEGDYIEEEGIRVTVERLYSSGAVKLKIETTEPDTEISVSSTSVSSSYGCTLIPFPTSKRFDIGMDEQVRYKFSIINKCSQPVDVRNIDFESSSSMWQLPNLATWILEPNQEAYIEVLIDTLNIRAGTYTNNLIIRGFYGNTPVTVTIPITVNVKGTYGSTNLGQPTIIAPKSIQTNTEFEISVTNVMDTDGVVLQFVPNNAGCDPSSISILNNVYKIKCSIIKPGVYTVTANIYRRNVLLPECDGTEEACSPKTTIVGTTGNIQVVFEPELTVGETSKIKVIDSGVDITEGATITVNGIQASTITPEEGVEYNVVVSIEGQQPISITAVPSKNELNVIIPEYIYEGDSIPTSVTDKETGDVVDYVVYVDGEKVGKYWTAEKGLHDITIVAKGYKNYTTEVNVETLPDINFNGKNPSTDKIYTGDVIEIGLSKNIDWEVTVFTKEGSTYLVSKGSSNIIKFKVDRAGTYQVKTGNRVLVSFEAENAGIPIIGGIFGFVASNLWILLILPIAAAIMIIYKSKKEGAKIGYGGSPDMDEFSEIVEKIE